MKRSALVARSTYFFFGAGQGGGAVGMACRPARENAWGSGEAKSDFKNANIADAIAAHDPITGGASWVLPGGVA